MKTALWIGGKLLSLLAREQNVPESEMFERFLSGMARVVVLTIIVGMLTGTIIIGLLWAIYSSLITYGGLEPLESLAVVGFATLALAAILAVATHSYIKRLFELPKIMYKEQHPLRSYVMTVGRAFLRGLKKPAAYRYYKTRRAA